MSCRKRAASACSGGGDGGGDNTNDVNVFKAADAAEATEPSALATKTERLHKCLTREQWAQKCLQIALVVVVVVVSPASYEVAKTSLPDSSKRLILMGAAESSVFVAVARSL